MTDAELVFWHATPSPHVAPIIRALAATPRAVRVILAEGMDPSRKAMGWREPDFGLAEVIRAPSPATVRSLVAEGDEACVHIFSEFIANAQVRTALKSAAAGPVRLGLLSEGRDWRGTKGWLRRLDGLRRERPFGRRADFVLAIGHLGVNWFRRCGVPAARCFEFGYAVEPPSEPPDLVVAAPATPAPRFLFVGQLIRRKRPDLLLRAFSGLPGAWSLRIAGAGPEWPALIAQVRREGLADRVRFLGVMDNRAIREEMAAADVLILPSDWDGWGAVVNEALMGGARVLCSDFCGAASLLRNVSHGVVFPTGSVLELTRALAAEIQRGPRSPAQRTAIGAYGRGVGAESLAAYLGDILAHLWEGSARPSPPWTHENGGRPG